MASSSGSKHSGSFGLVLGGKLKLKGASEGKKRKKRDKMPMPAPDCDGDDDGDEGALAAATAEYSAAPVAGTGKITSSGVVLTGHGTSFSTELGVGDTLLVTVVDRYRNTETNESRRINMVLGASSVNIEAPFTCDLTAPTSFMFVRRAPDIDAIRAARAEERKKARREVQDAKEVTYKVLKGDSGPGKVWKTVTEKVDGGMTREEMLERRAREKADRHCK